MNWLWTIYYCARNLWLRSFVQLLMYPIMYNASNKGVNAQIKINTNKDRKRGLES